jgi:alpha-1,3-rhamnosyl/mannosyltransferase
MRVIINQWSAGINRTGIGNYAHQLLRFLRQSDTTAEFLSYPPMWVQQARAAGHRLAAGSKSARAQARTRRSASLPRRLEDSPAGLSWGRVPAGKYLRLVGHRLRAWHFRAGCAWQRPDLYHEPNYIPLPCDVPALATIHDLSVLRHPQWHPHDRVAFYERHFPQALAQCRHLIAGSDFTRQEIVRHLGVPPERVTRVYYGIRDALGPVPHDVLAPHTSRLELPARYLLFVGTIEPRKNVLMLLRAYCALPDALRRDCPLVLAGQWGWNAGPVWDYWHNEARHRGVRHLGYVPDGDLPVLYNGARGLVYPSRYEGFGMPPLEMMACGGAVLVSTAGAVAEAVGPHGQHIAPDDQDGWRDAMQRLVTDEDWRHSLRRGVVTWARQYTWSRCAAQTLEVYRHVLASPSQFAGRAA